MIAITAKILLAWSGLTNLGIQTPIPGPVVLAYAFRNPNHVVIVPPGGAVHMNPELDTDALKACPECRSLAIPTRPLMPGSFP